MKNSFLTLFLSLLLFSAFSGIAENVQVGSSNPAKVSLISSDIQTSVVKFELDGYQLKEIMTPKGIQYSVSLEGTTPILQKGSPDLTKMEASLIIPDQGGTQIEIIGSSYKDYPNVMIAPSKGNLIRTIDPEQVPFKYSKKYRKDTFFPGKLAETRTPYIVRDFRGQVILAYPFQYNPVTKVLRVYSSITVKLFSQGTSKVNVLPANRAITRMDREFKQIYQHKFLNFNIQKYNPVDEQGPMIVISYGPFMQSMQPFVDWKISMGIPTTMYDVATIGANSTNIKAFIKERYDNDGTAYVLLVGDQAQVPTFMATAGASDNSYSYVSGTDHYPDLFVGRFSAENIEQVVTQVQKSLNYEINPVTTGDWMKHGIGIGSSQGPGDDNEMDYQHIRNLRTQLMGYTYSSMAELYDGSQGGMDAAGDPSPAMVSTEVNAGASIICYTGHGSQTSWGTTGFSNTQVNALTNNGMLPFIWSVACVNGDFTGSTCFAEAWLRAKQGAQLTGAVATLMSTINQSWNPPMEGEDEMVALLVESYANNIKRTFGGLSMNGCMKMNDTYGAGGTDMTDTWNVFGDPSLMVRTNNAIQITASHDPTVFIGTSSLPISCPIENALACVTLNGNILGTGVVTAGAVIVNFSQPLSQIDTIKLVITGYNCIPYIVNIPVIAASGPYISVNNYILNDPTGNNNGLPDFGESINLDVTLRNLGVAVSNGVNATISTTSPYITITDNSQGFGNINPNNNSVQNNAYSFNIANNVPDHSTAGFNIAITDISGNNWNSNFSVILNAPKLEANTANIDDAAGNNNHRMDPGETLNLVIPNQNIGHADAPNCMGVLTSASPYVTIVNTNFALNTLVAGTSSNATYEIQVSPLTPVGTVVTFNYTVTSGAYSFNKTFNIMAGMVSEDWETGTFNHFDWQNAGNVPWVLVNSGAYEGTYCAKSGTIVDNQTSELLITMNVVGEDSISFFRKVSSEATYDFLQFFIDADKKDEWSGEVDWAKSGYLVTPGTHTFKWVYVKDYMVSAGQDAAWVDFINFPPVSFATGVPTEQPTTAQFNVYPNPAKDQANVDYSLTKSGKVTLTLTNSLGQVVSQILKDSQKGEGIYRVVVDTRNLTPGVYFINLETEGNAINKKLIISK